ncbi:Lipoprotein-anchoring transpeptidase ErfK/SrfK [Corynebacterium timonense]|uniref:Lipoprotein-anchoring transpeptidase ErfK/SrfK n=2 Tax=Corynebacterium timonense TaxID=441500 RepID=A0A1H1LIS5_9CORY|nr:Lipoprotein-anchoring transpeptidase ErfK/SrfK [Corynebacterium timonense]
MAAVVVAAGLVLAGCSIGAAAGLGGEGTRASETADERSREEAARAAAPTVSVGDGDADVAPLDPVEVTAEAGLSSLMLTNDAGKRVQGEFNDDMTEWRATEELGYGRTYTLEGMDRAGNAIESSFSTVVPAVQAYASVGPLDGATVGVGQAVTFRFSAAPEDRDAVEEQITVETSNDTEGDFYWLDPYELRWRPKDYWEPGTSVSVKADLYGADLGGGVYGAEDTETNFTIGDEVITRVDNATKTLTLSRNGEVVRSFPISMGTDGMWDTPNGTYVVGDQHEALVMDSRTFGLGLDSGGYVTPVDSATQLSYSGIYVHSAPWAMWALGSTNQSHGCINASPADAAWFLQNVKRGDPVEVVNTYGGTLSGWDGLGYWNIPWETWEAGNPELQ